MKKSGASDDGGLVPNFSSLVLQKKQQESYPSGKVGDKRRNYSQEPVRNRVTFRPGKKQGDSMKKRTALRGQWVTPPSMLFPANESSSSSDRTSSNVSGTKQQEFSDFDLRFHSSSAPALGGLGTRDNQRSVQTSDLRSSSSSFPVEQYIPSSGYLGYTRQQIRKQHEVLSRTLAAGKFSDPQARSPSGTQLRMLNVKNEQVKAFAKS